MVVTNTFWKTNPQTTWTGEYQASPKDLPDREKTFCELYVSLLKVEKIIISSPKPWGCIPSHWTKKHHSSRPNKPWMIFLPGDHFFRFHPFWSKGEYFTNGWFPIKAHWGIPLFITRNGTVSSIPLITLPAMALCCRLSNFFFAESLSFSQVFSSRTKYLEANSHPSKLLQ